MLKRHTGKVRHMFHFLCFKWKAGGFVTWGEKKVYSKFFLKTCLLFVCLWEKRPHTTLLGGTKSKRQQKVAFTEVKLTV